eukprot:gnl/Dysnectes_brevis/2983_a3675_734.p1 GENE.gnl/Dysnectes_brevis/2983_a3675_734~~gnl/Dysnectes_brevis/2983_a3675_734.p1  ORF type:complete len:272 (+),score=101.30 gnl/Dysnectes_brevis/2983_a3675_734:822-1637(+)
MVRLLFNCGENKVQFLLETTLKASSDDVTNVLITMNNSFIILQSLCNELKTLSQHGPTRDPELRSLEPTAGEKMGPNVDEHLQRTGFPPSEQAKQTIATTITEIETAISPDRAERRETINQETLDRFFELVKGTLMIAWPQGLPPYEPSRLALDGLTELLSGEVKEQGLFNTQEAEVFFAGKTLRARGATLAGLRCPESGLVKVRPSKSSAYAPSSFGGTSQAEAMRYMFEREKRLKTAELRTGEEAFQSEWADPNRLRRQFMGMGDVKFK